MRKSISQGFLLRLGLTSVACTVLASVAAFTGFEHELEQRQIRFLAQYVQERTDNVDRRFSDLIVLQQNPLEDIRNTLSIESVMKNGRLYDGETLNEQWPRTTTEPAVWFQCEAQVAGH